MLRFLSTVLCGCLWSAPIDDARKVLTDASRAKEGDQRRETAVALSLVASKDPVANLLEELVKDKDYQVRVAALNSMGELNDKTRIPLLKTALNDDVPEVAFAAAKALYGLKDPAGLDALEAVYGKDMKAKSGFFKKEMLDSFRQLKTPRSAFFFMMQHGVGFVPLPGVGAGYNAMIGMLTDADFSSRAVSLLVVCSDRGKACDEMLGSAFSDEDWSVRAAAVHLAATRNMPALRPKVEALLSDKKEKVRLRASAACVRMSATTSSSRQTGRSVANPRR